LVGEIGYDLRSRVASERFVDAAEATVLELAYVYDLANRVREIRRQPFDLLVIQCTYTNGFVSQTDTLNGLRRTATPDLDFGLTATTTTVNAQAQTVESTSNEFRGGAHPTPLDDRGGGHWGIVLDRLRVAALR
jgi:hypothetical protein